MGGLVQGFRSQVRLHAQLEVESVGLERDEVGDYISEVG